MDGIGADTEPMEPLSSLLAEPPNPTTQRCRVGGDDGARLAPDLVLHGDGVRVGEVGEPVATPADIGMGVLRELAEPLRDLALAAAGCQSEDAVGLLGGHGCGPVPTGSSAPGSSASRSTTSRSRSSTKTSTCAPSAIGP